MGHDIEQLMAAANYEANRSARIEQLAEAMAGALEPVALLSGDTNMNDPLRRWLTVGHLQQASETLAAWQARHKQEKA